MDKYKGPIPDRNEAIRLFYEGKIDAEAFGIAMDRLALEALEKKNRTLAAIREKQAAELRETI